MFIVKLAQNLTSAELTVVGDFLELAVIIAISDGVYYSVSDFELEAGLLKKLLYAQFENEIDIMRDNEAPTNDITALKALYLKVCNILD